MVFKVQNQNWLLLDKFFLNFDDSHTILTRIVSQIWTCFQNQNPTIIVQTATILVCVIEFLRQNWAGGWFILSIFFFGGGAVFSKHFIWQYIKKHYWWPWQIWPRTGGYLGKNLNCIKTRAYLANIRISIYSQEFHITCKFVVLLCFKLLGFENPRSDWTWGHKWEGLKTLFLHCYFWIFNKHN